MTNSPKIVAQPRDLCHTRRASTNVRLRWEYRPGSELFIVYNDERDTHLQRFPALQNRAFIVKATRLFRF